MALTMLSAAIKKTVQFNASFIMSIFATLEKFIEQQWILYFYGPNKTN